MSDEYFKIAVIGMACRFPAAPDLPSFWTALKEGRSCGQSLRGGDGGDGLVHFGFPLEDATRFDAEFFGISAHEARLMDPQQRIFLQEAHAALENAGIAPRGHRGRTGVFASCNFNGYALRMARRFLSARPVELVDLLSGNDKDYLAARVAHKLNLRGPALNVQCACSSSLAAVALACQSLVAGQCDMALAGGVGLKTGQLAGYAYEPGGPLSIDGHVRSYSDDASGVNEGEGCAVVVLKRLDEARADRNVIYAVISGYAMGNDGADKASFYAPSLEGQRAVAAEAMAMAGVDPLDMGLVEGHGTATPVGDPIEVAALTAAWNLPPDAPRQYCALGSVKASIGHLNAAAGVAGLVKAVLALHHAIIPPIVDFRAPHPDLVLPETPFRIAASPEPWPAPPGGTRCAAVNSLGIGGNNVHLVLEEHREDPHNPTRSDQAEADAKGPFLVPLSAETESALERRCEDLARHLENNPASDMRDVAGTLLLGRDHLSLRRALVCRDREDLVHSLRSTVSRRKISLLDDPDKTVPVAFLFPGFGSQHPGMLEGLRTWCPAFAREHEAMRAIVSDETGIDVVAAARDWKSLRDSVAGTLALFAAECALAAWLDRLGLKPEYVMGNSAGEYAAAVAAGVLSAEDAARVLAARSRLVDSTPRGAMLHVPFGWERIAALCAEEALANLGPASLPMPDHCVVSGPVDTVERLEAVLAERGVETIRIPAERAGHSALLDPVLPQFENFLRGTRFGMPRVRMLSNVTGTWLADEATTPEYWTRQLRSPVRLGDQLAALCAVGGVALLEVGPGRRMSAALCRHPALRGRPRIVSLFPAETGRIDEPTAFLAAFGSLWQQGAHVDWRAFEKALVHGRPTALPSYPFEGEIFELETPAREAEPDPRGPAPGGSGDADRGENTGPRLAAMLWSELVPERESRTANPGSESSASGATFGRRPHTALIGWPWSGTPQGPPADLGPVLVYATLEELQDACAANPELVPDIIVDARHLDAPEEDAGEEEGLESAARTCDSATALCSWLCQQPAARRREVYWLARGAASLGRTPRMDRSVLLAPARVLPFEASSTYACVVDPDDGTGPDGILAILARLVTGGAAANLPTSLVAERMGRLWTERPQERPWPAQISLFPGDGVYLVLGGSGGIGRSFMRFLAARARESRARATLVPVQRSLPDESAWDDIRNLGACVIPMRADLRNDDLGTLDRALCGICARHGPLRGVFHAAGVPGGSLMQTMTRGLADMDNWKTRAMPLRWLDRLLEREKPGFVLLNSSVGSLCGSMGQLDNCAANVVQDAWTAIRSASAGSGTRIASVRWDVWLGTGMITSMAELHERLSGRKIAGGIRLEDAEPAFDACLACRDVLPLVTGERVDAMLEEAVAKRGLARDFLESADIRASRDGGGRSRPAAAQKPPSSALERLLAELFGRRLGIDGVGPHDDFVELGGNSLVGMPLAREVRDILAVPSFTVGTLFRHRTPAGIARALSKDDGEAARLEELALLYEKVGNMSDEEISGSLEEKS